MSEPYFSVNELQNRYGLGKQAELNRRKHLGIETVKVDGKAQITVSDLELLDQLHEFLKTTGNTMANFKPHTMVKTSVQDETIPLNTEYEAIESVKADLVEKTIQPPIPGLFQSSPDTFKYFIKEMVVNTVSELNLVSPISHWERLQIAAEQGFWLTSKEVKQLVGTTPHVSQENKTWQRGCFLFTQVGKIGNQSGWKVTRLD